MNIGTGLFLTLLASGIIFSADLGMIGAFISFLVGYYFGTEVDLKKEL